MATQRDLAFVGAWSAGVAMAWLVWACFEAPTWARRASHIGIAVAGMMAVIATIRCAGVWDEPSALVANAPLYLVATLSALGLLLGAGAIVWRWAPHWLTVCIAVILALWLIPVAVAVRIGWLAVVGVAALIILGVLSYQYRRGPALVEFAAKATMGGLFLISGVCATTWTLL